MAPPIHVLVVDDDDDVRLTLELVLEADGFRVSVARNGVEALAEVDRIDQPAVMLLDLRMPVMSGWDVLDALRREGRLEKVPIIICTSAPEDAPEGFPVIPKPVDLDAMVRAIHRAARPPT
jgi:CheY-like chemotaxis protein